MHPTLTHVALQARDLDATLDFYLRFCGLEVVHRRGGRGETPVVWVAEPGKGEHFVFVLMQGDAVKAQDPRDYGHLGFALESRAAVDAVAARAQEAGCLIWPPRQEPYPVGYYCGLRDPDGRFVEFSYGQPLGPGAP